MTDKPKKPRGAAAWSPEFRKQMAIKGGKAGKPENRAFARDPELAKRAYQAGLGKRYEASKKALDPKG